MRWNLFYAGDLVASGLDESTVASIKKRAGGSIMRGSAWIDLVDPATGAPVELFVAAGASLAFVGVV